MSSLTVPAPPALPATRTTPEIIRGSMWVIWIATVLFTLAVIFGADEHKNAVKTVAYDTAPSIIAAQEIKAWLADMDANVANELLLTEEKDKKAAVKAYNDRRQMVTKALVTAAKNITIDDERKPIEAIELSLGEYEAKVQQVRDFSKPEDKNRRLIAYRESAAIMDKSLLPQADELDKINSDELKRAYTSQSSGSIGSLLLVIFSGLFLVGSLLALQVFLNSRTRRLINPALLAASAVTLVFLLYSSYAFLNESDRLDRIKNAEFGSLSALWEARATAYAANADESRYLFDSEKELTYDTEFRRKAARLATATHGNSLTDAASQAVHEAAAKQKVSSLDGLLGKELDNVTYPGELEAATDALSNFLTYLQIDEKIRVLERSGDRAGAIALCTGVGANQSNGVFSNFDRAMEHAIALNQKEFDQDREDANSEVSGFGKTTPVVAMIIGLLTLLGLRPRLKEYEA